MGIDGPTNSTEPIINTEEVAPVVLVGVKIRPDGTHDYSHALTMLDPVDIIETKPEITKESEEKEPESWLNMEREGVFAKEIEFFENIIKTEEGGVELRRIFLMMFNGPIVEAGRPALTSEELSSLEYVAVTSTGCSEISGHKIERPILLFGDTSEFDNFYKRLTGELGSGGFHLQGNVFDKNSGWSKTGLIITTNNRDFITHEVRHTVDPYIGERTGTDSMIEEAFGYYQEMVTDCFSGKRQAGDPINGPWVMLQTAITGVSYYEKYFPDAEQRPTYEEFQEAGEVLVKKIRSLHETLGPLETQRILAKTKTIEEILRVTTS